MDQMTLEEAVAKHGTDWVSACQDEKLEWSPDVAAYLTPETLAQQHKRMKKQTAKQPGEVRRDPRGEVQGARQRHGSDAAGAKAGKKKKRVDRKRKASEGSGGNRARPLGREGNLE